MSEFPIEKDSYLAFDALSLKQHIKDQLNEAGVFTDQNYEGSYISTIIDIVSYTFNTLMFYVNKTSTESMFSEAQLYENMNRIVKVLDYKPIGNQTSTLSFTASAAGTGETAPVGLYTIPRYTYIDVNGIPYCLNEDITFAKTTADQTEELTDMSNQKLLYQGSYIEYPLQTAIGQENEVVFMTPGDNVIIDHFNIDVYIKEPGSSWREWERTPTLYLEDANKESYEIRFNENKHYEVRFGNGINGKKLPADSQVAIYYLKSNGPDGEVGANVLLGKNIIKLETIQFNEIITDVVAGQYTFLTDLTKLSFDNDSVSSYSSDEEDVDSIRQNAPGAFRSQYRLVTESDYENYVKTNFANLIHDVTVVNNWAYLSEQLKYYHDIGISQPNNVSRVLFNQVMFGDSCNFNNVYILAVPKTLSNITNASVTLNPAQKELIISSMRSEKTLTAEVIINDPVYVAVGLGLPLVAGVSANTSDLNQGEILIIKDENSRRDNTSIQEDVVNVFTDYFARENVELGQELDITQLTANVLSVQGVQTFYTRRKDNPAVRVEGLSMLVWNPIYPTADITTAIKNLALPYFKFPYLNNASKFSSNVVIQTQSKTYEVVEY